MVAAGEVVALEMEEVLDEEEIDVEDEELELDVLV